ARGSSLGRGRFRRRRARAAPRQRRARWRALHPARHRPRLPCERGRGARGDRRRRLRRNRGGGGRTAPGRAQRPGVAGLARPVPGAARRQGAAVRRQPGAGQLPAPAGRAAGHRTGCRTQGRGRRRARGRAAGAPDRPQRRPHLPPRPAEPGLVAAGQARRRHFRRTHRRRGRGRARHREAQAGRHAGVELQRIRRTDTRAVPGADRRARPLHGRAPARRAGAGTRGACGGRCRPSRRPGPAPGRGTGRADGGGRRAGDGEAGVGGFLLAGVAWGFAAGGLEVGANLLLYWVLWTGGLGALGCLIAGGHPLSILGAFVSSPFTPLHPALASGTVSAAIEAWVRKPTYADFMALREDVNTVRGWWRNRVARVLVNFFLTSLGTAIGVWTGGARMLARLFG